MKPPLAGVRVLDFGHILAGPYCARLLAELGADVVKIESRSRGEGMGRHKLGDDYKGRRDRSPHMLMTNRNKRSVTLNLKTPKGVELAKRLASVADVLVENFSAGTMDRLGLGYADLQLSNPGLVYLSLSGYGHEGPRRDWTSMNLNLQAYSGLMMTTGEEGDPPTTLAASWNDYLGALHGCAAVLNALLERKKSGRGANLDLSQFECSVASLGALVMASAFTKSVPPRQGSHPSDALMSGVYRCAGRDEWIAISVQTEAQLGALTELCGAEDVEHWTSQHSPSEAEAALQAADIPAERMRRSRDLLAESNAERLFPPVEDPPGFNQRMAQAPFRFSHAALSTPSRAPQVGEHTGDVLREWLGIEDAAALEAEDALV